jgi:hypothetical protein
MFPLRTRDFAQLEDRPSAYCAYHLAVPEPTFLAYRWRFPMSPAAREFEDFAEDCIRFAGQTENPKLRERLLKIAQDWLQAAMHEQGPAIDQTRSRLPKEH